MQTVDLPSYQVGSDTYFTAKKAQELLGIRHPWTMRKYLETLGIETDSYLGWEEIKKMLGLKLFLKQNHGYHSHGMFEALILSKNDAYVLQKLGINLDQEFENLRRKNGS